MWISVLTNYFFMFFHLKATVQWTNAIHIEISIPFGLIVVILSFFYPRLFYRSSFFYAFFFISSVWTRSFLFVFLLLLLSWFLRYFVFVFIKAVFFFIESIFDWIESFLKGSDVGESVKNSFMSFLILFRFSRFIRW